MPDVPKLPAIAAAPLSAVLLASEGDGDLEAKVGAWAAHLDTLGREYELLLADDSAVERTAALVEVLTLGCPRLRVLRDAERRGVGAALRTALAAAQYPLFFYTDCTGQFQPADLNLLLGQIDNVH